MRRSLAWITRFRVTSPTATRRVAITASLSAIPMTGELQDVIQRSAMKSCSNSGTRCSDRCVAEFGLGQLSSLHPRRGARDQPFPAFPPGARDKTLGFCAAGPRDPPSFFSPLNSVIELPTRRLNAVGIGSTPPNPGIYAMLYCRNPLGHAVIFPAGPTSIGSYDACNLDADETGACCRRGLTVSWRSPPCAGRWHRVVHPGPGGPR